MSARQDALVGRPFREVGLHAQVSLEVDALAAEARRRSVAAAVGTPCVGLYGPMPARRCGPYGAQHIALQNANLDGKMKNRRSAANEAMLAIHSEEVSAACDAILDRSNIANPGKPIMPELARAA